MDPSGDTPGSAVRPAGALRARGWHGLLVWIVVGAVPLLRTWQANLFPIGRSMAVGVVSLASSIALLVAIARVPPRRWLARGVCVASIAAIGGLAGLSSGSRYVPVWLAAGVVIAAWMVLDWSPTPSARRPQVLDEVVVGAAMIGAGTLGLRGDLEVRAISLLYAFALSWLTLRSVFHLGSRTGSPASMPTAVSTRVPPGARGTHPSDTAVTWWLVMTPVMAAWAASSVPTGSDPSWFPLGVTVAVVLAAWWPRRGLIAGVVGSAWVLSTAMPAMAVRYVLLAWLVAAAWGWYLGVVPLSRGGRERPGYRAIPALVLVAVAEALVLWRSMDPTQAVFLSAIGLTLAVLAAAGSPHVVAVARLGAPCAAAIGRRCTPLLVRYRSMIERARHAARDWWAGELPARVPPETADVESRGTEGGPGVLTALGRYRYPLSIWLGTFLLVNLSRILVPPGNPGEPQRWFDLAASRASLGRGDLVMRWLHWDAWQYIRIAQNGYNYESGVYILGNGDQAPVAWLPGYSMAIRAVAGLLGSTSGAYHTAAVLVTVFSGLASILLFWKWLSLKGITGRARVTSTLCVAWLPYSFMLYGAGWNDAFFVMLVLWAFVSMEQDRPVQAGLVAAFATVVRINAVGLVFAMAIVWWRRAGDSDAVPRHRFRNALADRRWTSGLAISVSGLVGFIVWCWVRYGEPLLYWNAHSALFGSNTPAHADVLKLKFLPSVVQRFDELPASMVNLVVAAALTVLTLVSTPAVRRRYGGEYTAFLLVIVAVIWLGSFDFIGAGRYLLCAFPVAALWGEWLSRRVILRRVLGFTGLTGMLVMTFAYTRAFDLGY